MVPACALVPESKKDAPIAALEKYTTRCYPKDMSRKVADYPLAARAKSAWANTMVGSALVPLPIIKVWRAKAPG